MSKHCKRQTNNEHENNKWLRLYMLLSVKRMNSDRKWGSTIGAINRGKERANNIYRGVRHGEGKTL